MAWHRMSAWRTWSFMALAFAAACSAASSFTAASRFWCMQGRMEWFDSPRREQIGRIEYLADEWMKNACFWYACSYLSLLCLGLVCCLGLGSLLLHAWVQHDMIECSVARSCAKQCNAMQLSVQNSVLKSEAGINSHCPNQYNSSVRTVQIWMQMDRWTDGQLDTRTHGQMDS